MKPFFIPPINQTISPQVQNKIDNLNKPKGSLGRLEQLALQICLIQQTLEPRLSHPCHLLLGADHGIEHEKVSVSPRCITWQQMLNFANGGGGINMFCRQHGFDLQIVDVGVDYDLSHEPRIANHKIGTHGTQNFLYQPAMTTPELNQCIETGAMLADQCHAKGCNILSLGEMGIANTSPSSIWMSMFCHLPLCQCIGAGAGLTPEGMIHKQYVLQQAIEHYQTHFSQLSPIQYFGGFEMVTAIGAMLRAAELKMIIIIDGFIMTACVLAAQTLYPNITDYCIFGHCGDEAGHQLMLNYLKAKPLLHLNMRLGEGTGAICAYPIIDSSVRMINELNNFTNANILKYF